MRKLTRRPAAPILWREQVRSRKAMLIGALVLAVALTLAGWTVAWETHVRRIACAVSTVVDSPKDFNKWGEPTAFDRQVRTRNCGVLNMNNDWLRPPAAAIHSSGSYELTVIGWRSPFFDTTPNIVAAAPSS